MLLHAVGDLLQSVVVLDVVEGLDDGVVLFGILVDELLVDDDTEPFGGIWQAVHVVAVLVGHLLALIVEKLVSLSILQRFEVVLIFGILIEAADTEHGRGVVLSEFGRQSGLVAAGGGALNIHFHAGLLGVHFGEFVPLIDNFRLVVQEIDLSFVVRGVGTAGADAHQHGQRADSGDAFREILHGVSFPPCDLPSSEITCQGHMRDLSCLMQSDRGLILADGYRLCRTGPRLIVSNRFATVKVGGFMRVGVFFVAVLRHVSRLCRYK